MSSEKAQDSNVGDCSGMSTICLEEKGSRNKRKFVSDSPLGDLEKSIGLVGISSSENESQGYEVSADRFENTPIHNHHDICRMCGCTKDNLDGSKQELKLPSPVKPTDLESVQGGVEQESIELDDVYWSDPTESELEELCLTNLDSIFKSAIKMIAASGYSEDVASKAVLRTGLCYGCKDTLSNIVDNTLDILQKGQEIAASRDHLFENLEQLEKYILAEMVCLLKEVNPLYNTGDAMWRLLICDMNVSHACAADSDPLGSLDSNDSPADNSSASVVPELDPKANSPDADQPKTTNSNSSAVNTNCSHHDLLAAKGLPNLPNPKISLAGEGKTTTKVSLSSTSNKIKKLSVIEERVQVLSQSSSTVEKPVCGKKGHSSCGKRETILRQKIQLEKSYRGTMRPGKFSGMILDKKFRSVTDSIGVRPKNASMKMNKAMEVNIQAHGNSHVSLTGGNSSSSESSPSASNKKTADTSAALPKANVELSPSLASESNIDSNVTTSSSIMPDFSHYGIPYDKTTGMWVPKDSQDQVILKLATKVQELQNQLGKWTDWANHKVTQATRRLIKDKVELKALKQEKEEVERIQKERQSLEESTIRKHSEMENAMSKATEQVKQADAVAQKLEDENSKLKKEMDDALKQSEVELASFNETSEREKKTMKILESAEWQKTSLQEEHLALNQRRIQLEQELEEEEKNLNRLEARQEEVKKQKDELLALAESRRKEREQIEASGRSEENTIKLESMNKMMRHENAIRDLERQIAELKLKTDSSKLAAPRWGADGNHGHLTARGSIRDKLQTKHVKRERECVMCLTEEVSVVFLPCAHQVVCIKCNKLHDSQGMKDCPSCRTHIERRICARFHSPT